MGEPAIFQMVKSGTFGVVYFAFLAGAKIVSVFQAMPFYKELHGDAVSIEQHIQRFEHLVYAFVAGRPELDYGFPALEGSL